MRLLAVCAALCVSTASPSAAMEFAPTELTFAYTRRHAPVELPRAALLALRPSAGTPEMPGGDAEQYPRSARTFSRVELCSAAASVAEANALPIPFFANLIQQESGWKPHVVSPAGAQGIAQFMPKVARAYGLHNPFDPIHALAVSARFLRELLGQFGNIGLAAAAYNAGPKRVQNWMARRGKLPAETRDYVRNITGHPAERWVGTNAAGLRLPALARCPDAATQEAQALERAKPEPKVVQVAVKASKTNGKQILIVTSAPAGKQVVAPKAALAAKVATKPALAAKLATKPALAAKAAPKLALKIMAPEKGARTPAKAAPTSAKTPTKIAVASKAPAAAKPAAKVAANTPKKTPAAKPAAKRVKLAARGS